MRLSKLLPETIHIIITHGEVMCLIVLTGVFNVVILDTRISVGTPLGTERHLCVGASGTLCGYKDHTVSTTSTIEGVGSSVLKHGHACDVGRVDIVKISAVGKSVEHYKRGSPGIDRADTTDKDSRVFGKTVDRKHLQTCHIAAQGFDRVCDLLTLDVGGAHHAGSTGECLTLLFTEGNHHDFIHHLRMKFESNHKIRLYIDNLCLIADVRNFKPLIGLTQTGKRELTVNVSGTSDIRTNDTHGSTNQR